MCISTAYAGSEAGTVLASNIVTVVQRDGRLVLTDILGRETALTGVLTLADLTRGVLVIEPA